METNTKTALYVIASAGVIVGGYFGYKLYQKTKAADAAAAAFDFGPAIAFIEQREGFSSEPKWDNKQWSWGYGTAAGYDINNRPTDTITRAEAEQDLIDYIRSEFVRIKVKLDPSINLSNNQMTALLSFDFNLGFGATKKVISVINSGAGAAAVTAKMNLYVYSAGQISSDLVQRRQKEAQLYLS